MIVHINGYPWREPSPRSTLCGADFVGKPYTDGTSTWIGYIQVKNGNMAYVWHDTENTQCSECVKLMDLAVLATIDI